MNGERVAPTLEAQTVRDVLQRARATQRHSALLLRQSAELHQQWSVSLDRLGLLTPLVGCTVGDEATSQLGAHRSDQSASGP